MEPTPPDRAVLGTVLAALHNAPFCTSLRAEAIVESNGTAQMELMRRRASTPGGGARLVMIGTEPADNEWDTSRTTAYIDGAGRIRVESHGHVSISDRNGTTRISPDGTVSHSEERGPFSLQLPALLLIPWPLAAVLRIGAASVGSVAGRDGWWLDAALAEGPSMVLMQLGWWGENFRLGVDAETGAVTSLDGLVDGETITRVRWPVFEPDVRIDPALFDAPDPTPVPVEVDGNASARRRFGPVVGLPAVEVQHPSDDPEQARADIENAYGKFNQLDPDGNHLPYVVGGHILGTLLVDAQRRFPNTEVRLTVDEIGFRSPTEAAVLYQLVMNGMPFGQRQGAALLVDGQWKVGYATVANLIAMAGVDCPPDPTQTL